MVKGGACAADENACRQCIVYRFGSLCTEEIKRLVHDQNDIQDSSMAIRQLMNRRRRSQEEN
jgi:hypothetical protein